MIIAIVVLFLLVCICFYFISLLYAKISKFDDLEKKQQQLMREMDDSIAVYLTELKDENDRLVERLTTIQQPVVELEKTPKTSFEQERVDVKTVVPMNIALKSYTQQSSKTTSTREEPKEDMSKMESSEVINDRTRAFRLHDAGESIEEIAKILGKGKTEIELILKFRN